MTRDEIEILIKEGLILKNKSTFKEKNIKKYEEIYRCLDGYNKWIESCPQILGFNVEDVYMNYKIYSTMNNEECLSNDIFMQVLRNSLHVKTKGGNKKKHFVKCTQKELDNSNLIC